MMKKRLTRLGDLNLPFLLLVFEFCVLNLIYLFNFIPRGEGKSEIFLLFVDVHTCACLVSWFFWFLPFDARPLGYVASMTPRRRQISDGGSSSGEGED